MYVWYHTYSVQCSEYIRLKLEGATLESLIPTHIVTLLLSPCPGLVRTLFPFLPPIWIYDHKLQIHQRLNIVWMMHGRPVWSQDEFVNTVMKYLSGADSVQYIHQKIPINHFHEHRSLLWQAQANTDSLDKESKIKKGEVFYPFTQSLSSQRVRRLFCRALFFPPSGSPWQPLRVQVWKIKKIKNK